MRLSSNYCRNMSVTVLEIGDPMAARFSGWYILFRNMKQFCEMTNFISFSIRSVTCSSLFFGMSRDFVITRVSSIGILKKVVFYIE